MSIAEAGTNISKETREKESKFWKVAKYLPFGSFLNYMLSEQYLREKSVPLGLGKMVLHALYAALPTATATLYLANSYETGAFLPRRQIEIKAEMKRQYSTLENALFEGETPLADTNRDGKVDLGERVDAYEKMGLGNQVHTSFPSFSRANLEQLEKAVKAYETKEERK